MESLDKRSRIQLAAMTLFETQGIDSTSVNEIVKRANVAKGTFYVYYKDKKALISEILIREHSQMLNELMNISYDKAKIEQRSWCLLFLEMLIDNYISNPKILMMIEQNILSFMDTNEHRTAIFENLELLDELLLELRHNGETRRDSLNRLMIMMQMIGAICYNSLYFSRPDNITHIQPILQDMMIRLCEKELCL